MLRPKALVLPDSALVPEAELKAPSKRFTHQVVAEQAFHHAPARPDVAPDGRFAPGTRLILLEHGDGPLCLVQDGQGMRAVTAFAGLRALR
ncbi:MAG: hypothetical protein ABJD97_01095 [Betaproteobacteria bacterium]